MKKKVEVLKNENIKDTIVDLLETELHIPVTLVDSSKEILGDEEYQIPIYLDLEDFNNEKLSDVVNEYEEDIINYLSDELTSAFDLSMVFGMNLSNVKMFIKVTNRDQDKEECINIILCY